MDRQTYKSCIFRACRFVLFFGSNSENDDVQDFFKEVLVHDWYSEVVQRSEGLRFHQQ